MQPHNLHDLVMALSLFICFQALDALTTLIFLQRGVTEGNPLVRTILTAAAGHITPALALAIAKVFPVVLGIAALRAGRRRLLANMSWLFAACVVWNLIAIYSA
jgi:hypothetical protein